MSDLINGRTPEEIKDGMQRCMKGRRCISGCKRCSYYPECLSGYSAGKMFRDAFAYIERLESERDAALAKVPKWINVKDRQPAPFVSVQVYMTDAGPFPPVREGYCIGKDQFFIPALSGIHPVSHWKPFDEPTKGDA